MEIPPGVITMAGLIALPILPRLVIGLGNLRMKAMDGAPAVSGNPKSEIAESPEPDKIYREDP